MKSEKHEFRKFEGITLISLVITIIILSLLAGIAINLSLGGNGVFTKTKQAKEETNKQTATEKINLKITTAQINKYSEEQRMPTLKELSLSLKEDEEIEYVIEKRQSASTKYEVGEKPSSIYTKLNEYPYEFEIDNSLQLASINGIKVANVSNKFFEDIILYNGGNAVAGNTITLSESAYNFKELLLDVGNRYIQVPIIQGETLIQQGGVSLYSATDPAKLILGVNANLNEDGTELTINSINISYSNQIGNNYAGGIIRVIGRYKIK